MKRAISDYEAFLPLQRLVSGPFTNADDLPAVERFIRTLLLHDEMILETFPKVAYLDETGKFKKTNFIGTAHEASAFSFSADGFECLLTRLSLDVYVGKGADGFAMQFFTRSEGFPQMGTPLRMGRGEGTFVESKVLSDASRAAHIRGTQFDKEVSAAAAAIELTPGVIQLAARYAEHGGAAGYEAYLACIRRVLAVVVQGGSALLESEFGVLAITIVRRYPELLFQNLDEKWQQYARQVDEDGLRLLIPPVLGIVLTRCARRDAIPSVIKDLRDEWSGARQKVWNLLDTLRVCRTLGEAVEIRNELAEASRLFSPERTEIDTRPLRVFWEILAAAGAGAGVAQLSGGNPIIGAATNTLGQVARSVPTLAHEFGSALFGRGAFDFARRVRRAVSQVELDALPRLLSDAERQTLGFR